MSTSSGDEEDEDILGDGLEWYLDDVTPLDPFGPFDNDAYTSIDDATIATTPLRRSARQGTQVSSNKFVSVFVANVEAEAQTPETVQQALQSP